MSSFYSISKKIFKNYLKIKYINKSFSQEGEDLILDRLFKSVEKGFYIDIGAHHPFRFSNTFKLYNKGWCGINIEPNPDGFHLFTKYRKRDININGGISSKDGNLTYYMFNESALNTFSKEESVKKNGLKGYHIIKQVKVPVFNFTNILKKYVKPDLEINFLNIDIEGFEWQVFSSGFLNTYRPQVIVVEILSSSYRSLKNNNLYNLLLDHNYNCFSKLYNSLIFTRDNFSEI